MLCPTLSKLWAKGSNEHVKGSFTCQRVVRSQCQPLHRHAFKLKTHSQHCIFGKTPGNTSWHIAAELQYAAVEETAKRDVKVN